MSDTQQGPGWWLASDGRWYPPQDGQPPVFEPQRRPVRWPWVGRPRWLVVLVALVVVAVAGVGVAGWVSSSSDGSSTAGTMSASACLSVVSAARDISAGSRTLPSFLAVVRAQEGPARQAASMDGRYLPISQAIVSVDEDVSAGRSGSAGMAVLFRECGS